MRKDLKNNGLTRADKSFPLRPRNVYSIDAANNRLPRLRSQRRNRGMQRHRLEVVLADFRRRVVEDRHARGGLRHDCEANSGENGAGAEIGLLHFSSSMWCHSSRLLQNCWISGSDE